MTLQLSDIISLRWILGNKKGKKNYILKTAIAKLKSMHILKGLDQYYYFNFHEYCFNFLRSSKKL